MQIEYYSNREISLIEESSKISAQIHKEISSIIHEGINFLELDNLIEEKIKSYNSEPSFKGYNNFPYSSCISINECVAHGHPPNREWLLEDIVKIDIGVKKGKYIGGDCCRTYYLGENKKILSLIENTYRNQEIVSQYLLKECQPNKTKLSDFIIKGQNFINHVGLHFIKELTGHGLGKRVHENPLIPPSVDAFSVRGFNDYTLKPGLVFTYEPIIINTPTYNLVGYEKESNPLFIEHKMSAQVEDVFAVLKDNVIKLTF